MAGKSISGDGLTAELAGMTKNQLYDIMSQMKILIEQNKQQAREILIQNPSLTRALFQAQIMLGMVQPPQVIPNIVRAASQQTQPSAQHSQQSNVQAARSFSGQVGLQDQVGASHAQPQMRKQPQRQPAMSTPSASAPPASLQPPSMPSHPLQVPLQAKGQLNPQVPSSSGPLSSQPPHSFHPASQSSSLHQPQMPSVSSQLQQSTQTAGFSHMPLQPPLPPQPRQSPMPGYHHQYGAQMGPNVGYQHTAGSQHPSQTMYHPGGKPPSSMGTSFQQGQPPLPSQPPPQSLYQAGGSHVGSDYNVQGGSAMQVDRGSSWMPGTADNTSMQQLSGPPSSVSGQMGAGNQAASSGLTPDMEQALLQQVMSLTPEQINLLPPDQRSQVLHLQQAIQSRQVQR